MLVCPSRSTRLDLMATTDACGIAEAAQFVGQSVPKTPTDAALLEENLRRVLTGARRERNGRPRL